MPILTTPGVVSVLSFGSDPVPIPEDEIEAVQTVLRSGRGAQPCPFPSTGQRIRVNHGCFTGLEGILIERKSTWRLVVSVTLLQRSVSVEIDHHLVSVL